MTRNGSHGSTSLPTAEELLRQVERTRKELGRTVGALSSKVDAATRAHDGMAGVKGQVGQATARLRITAAHVGRFAADKGKGKGLDSVRDKAVRAAARSNRTALIAAAGVLAGVLIVRRARRGTPGRR
ncbi:DUF3618 domain-containing protein [Streptomyces sp. NBC_00503]|uniref:DUF3618 domain-containing protein n=1 Tax=Streptomyces sp. NBC_00503 TaxID=2903659 RepID=UPI002E8095D8|nr:DUF3618 domain-containing protein [Streptomyces sp. NBC_00503]WUD85785.1 DUF3618 domain-containing protein [Streptomyces sp. NBC_00503]